MTQHIRISIPNAPSIQRQAGQIVLDAVRAAGLDPVKAAQVPLVRQLLGAWGRGEMTREQFIENFEKVAILNPLIKLQQ